MLRHISMPKGCRLGGVLLPVLLVSALVLQGCPAKTPATLTVTPPSQGVSAAAGSSASFQIETAGNWEASTDQAWAQLSATSGGGNATLVVSCQANTGSNPRSATVTITAPGATGSPASVTLTQDGLAPPATLGVTPSSRSVGATAGSTASFQVNTTTSWTASSNQGWATVSPASGTGNGTLTVNAQANTGSGSRSATLTITAPGATGSPASVTLTQDGAATVPSLTLTPSALVVAPAANSQASFEVQTTAAWTASSDQSWAKLSASSGSGDRTLTVTCDANPDFEDRAATLTVAAPGATGSPATLSLLQSARPLPSISSLSASATATKASSVTVSGTADPGASVRVSGGANTVTANAGPNGAFSMVVNLRTNRENRLAVTARVAGVDSPPAPLIVLQDTQLPTLNIDFPPNGATLTTDTVTVAGRVADILSGYSGLAVQVAGAPAAVDIGIGTNGTFERTSVPLALGANTITAVATDALGNARQTQITVTRVPLGDGPRMVVLSGDGQSARVYNALPQPLKVKVTQPDGTPFAGKAVTFRVTRSNGLLGAVANDLNARRRTLQLNTNANGEASAYFWMGSDAGCGNNRVEATSTDIQGTTFFCATAQPAPARQINIGSGNDQSGETGAPLAEPLRAWVNDSCNGSEGVPVTFTIVRGNGKVNGADSVTVDTAPTGHAEVNFTLGDEPGNNLIEATFPGNPTLPATFTAYGIARVQGAPTTLEGLVLNNSERPIGGVKALLLVNNTEIYDDAITDEQGVFRFENVAAGAAQLFLDGLAATAAGGEPVPPGSFPAISYNLTLVPGAANSLSGPVHLPALDPANAVTYDGTNDVELSIAGIEGLKMLVKAGSMTRRDGTKPTPAKPQVLSLNQVQHDDVPMPMPDGVSPPFAWTLQPAGATFDPPVQITYPNMSGLDPGAAAYFLSYNHDTEQFDIVASGAVTEDGSLIQSDPGSGLTIAGWGCNCPPYSVTAKCTSCSPLNGVAKGGATPTVAFDRATEGPGGNEWGYDDGYNCGTDTDDIISTSSDLGATTALMVGINGAEPPSEEDPDAKKNRIFFVPSSNLQSLLAFTPEGGSTDGSVDAYATRRLKLKIKTIATTSALRTIGDIEVRFGKDRASGTLLRKFPIVVYKKKVLPITLRLVNDAKGTPQLPGTIASIEKEVNKWLKHLVVQVSIKTGATVNDSWDLNKSGALEEDVLVKPDPETSALNNLIQGSADWTVLVLSYGGSVMYHPAGAARCGPQCISQKFPGSSGQDGSVFAFESLFPTDRNQFFLFSPSQAYPPQLINITDFNQNFILSAEIINVSGRIFEPNPVNQDYYKSDFLVTGTFGGRADPALFNGKKVLLVSVADSIPGLPYQANSLFRFSQTMSHEVGHYLVGLGHPPYDVLMQQGGFCDSLTCRETPFRFANPGEWDKVDRTDN